MIDNISLTVQTVSSAPGGATQTVIVDYSEVVTKIELSTQRFDAPASLSFTLLEESGIAISEGSSVEFTADGTKMFKGYVFTAERNRDGEVSYTARDQIRYLKASASYLFQNMSLPQIIQRIAADFGLAVGDIWIKKMKPAWISFSMPCPRRLCRQVRFIILRRLRKIVSQGSKKYVYPDHDRGQKPGHGLHLQAGH